MWHSPLASLEQLGILDKLCTTCAVDLDATNHASFTPAQTQSETIAALRKLPLSLQTTTVELIIARLQRGAVSCPICRRGRRPRARIKIPRTI